MNPFRSMTSQTGRIGSFIHEKVSPRLNNLYARLGFANRSLLAQNLRGLNIQNHDLLLDSLASKGILKNRFRKQINSSQDIKEHMLSGSVTLNQITAIEENINRLHNLENVGQIMESLEEGMGVATRAEIINQALAGKHFTAEEVFSKTTLNIASLLDRIFPTADGIHSKLASGLGSLLHFNPGSIGTLPGKYRLGFAGLLGLGVVAMIASPLLFPAAGALLCTLGFNAALGMKIAGGTVMGLGLLSRIAKRYVHLESDKWYVNAFTRLGRSTFLDKIAFPLGMVTAYTSFTFGSSVANTFPLGELFLNSGSLLLGITAGIPVSAILVSLMYYYVGTRRAIRATEGTPGPHGDEKLRIKDIKKTYAYSGSATVFSSMYFLYRLVATSIFVTGAFTPIAPLPVLLTGAAVIGGFFGLYALPNLFKNHRSPWRSYLTGTLGAVAAPMIAGALTGDYLAVGHSISALISLAVLAQDIHATTHGVMFHQGQVASLYPDRLVPAVTMGEKKACAGYFGRKGKKPITSFWEKAHVTPPDVVFSAVTSAIYEPNAYLKQCLLQCDMPNRGKGGGAGAVRQIVDIRDRSQAICDELYAMCRAKLDAYRRKPDNLQKNYREVINLLLNLGQYFGLRVPEIIKNMRDDFSQDWKGIYDASIDIGQKKGEEFLLWAHELEVRLQNNDQLTREEVENILLYFCDRFNKEFVLGVRKDSLEYVMRIQKNENQSGVREFIGNTAYEITRFNAKTGLASIERILATHIRRKDMEWQHDDSPEHNWFHRTDPYLENDPESVKEYRKQVKSHSKDLAFVINDANGTPLALQTHDGQILLIAEELPSPISLKIADGSVVQVWQRGDSFIGTGNGRTYQVDTIKNYNQSHDNQIWLVANNNHARAPLAAQQMPQQGSVIKDTNGNPAAVETNWGELILLQPLTKLDAVIKIIKSDGSVITIKKSQLVKDGKKEDAHLATDQLGNTFEINTLDEFNKKKGKEKKQEEEIHIVTTPNSPDQAIAITGLPKNMKYYYKDTHSRPLYTYAIDPHDYEFNLDSEFVNGRIALEYIPIFEQDRKNKHAAISYRDRRKIKLDYALSSIPVDDAGNAILPSNIQLNWSPMYMRLKTRDGQEYIVPYLEEKNGQVEPTLVVDKKPIDWKTFRNKYARHYTFNKNVCKSQNGRFSALIKMEYGISKGINEMVFSLPEAPFIIGYSNFAQEEFKNPAAIKELLETINPNAYNILLAAPKDSLERLNELLCVPYFYDRLVSNNIVDPDKLDDKIKSLIKATEDLRTNKYSDLSASQQEDIRRLNRLLIETIHKDICPKSYAVTPTNKEQFLTLLKNYEAVNPTQEIKIGQKRKYNWRRIISTEIDHGEGKIYFVYDTENGTTQTVEVPRHQSNAFEKGHQPAFDNYSIHFPPIDDIVSIKTEVFKQSVGTLPYARYFYRFDTLEEAEKRANAIVKRKADGTIAYDQNKQPMMEKGCPIWVVYDEDGKEVGYEFERFGRPESIFELGAFDPNTVDPNTLKIKKTRKGQVLTFDAIEWGRKMYPVEPNLMDLGTEDRPKAKIKGVITSAKEIKSHFGSGSILWGKTTDAAGRELHQAINLGRKVSNILSIMKVEFLKFENEQVHLGITRKQKHGELTFTDEAFGQMWYSAEWVEKVELGEMTPNGRQVKIYYKNPHTDKSLDGDRRMQVILSQHQHLKKIDNYYEPIMELREIYDKQGNCKLVPYLKVTRVTRSRLKISKDKLSPEQSQAIMNGTLSILTPKSALRLEMEDGREEILPLNDQIDGEDYIFDDQRASDEEKALFAHHLPHLEDGKVGLIIGPQLSISGRNWYGYALSGVPYCALDQSIFMAYDLNFGYNYGRQPYAYGVGGGNIQTHKSRAGDGRIREGTTVQNGTPVGRPLRKTIASGESWNEVEFREPFFSFAPMPATITEDYREGKGIYKKHGHSTVFHNKVVAIGAGVEDLSQILTQRRRWPTSVPIGQYWFFRDLWDELLNAKLAGLPLINKFTKPSPSFYTWDQLVHEWNGVTWYYAGIAEYLRSFAPLAYFGGFTAYPVDPIAFPAIWLGSFSSSMASHIYSMKKVGNHPLESVYWGQAAYKTLVPNYVEMILPQPGMPETQGRRIFEELFTSRLAKECLGQFGVTALSGGGKMDERYLRQISDDMWLKMAASIRGVLELGNVAHADQLLGGFAPDMFSQITTYFAIVMNTIWPFYDYALNSGALELAKNDRNEEPNMVDKTRFQLMAKMIQGELDKWYRPIKKNRMQYTLGITDFPKDKKEQGRFLQDLSAPELREVLRNMPGKAAPLLQEMLDGKHIIPTKVATVLEAMLYNNKEITDRAQSLFKAKLVKTKKIPPAELLAQAQNQTQAEAVFAAGLAVHIFTNLSSNHQAEVRQSMVEEKRQVLTAILP